MMSVGYPPYGQSNPHLMGLRDDNDNQHAEPWKVLSSHSTIKYSRFDVCWQLVLRLRHSTFVGNWFFDCATRQKQTRPEEINEMQYTIRMPVEIPVVLTVHDFTYRTIWFGNLSMKEQGKMYQYL